MPVVLYCQKENSLRFVFYDNLSIWVHTEGIRILGWMGDSSLFAIDKSCFSLKSFSDV